MIDAIEAAKRIIAGRQENGIIIADGEDAILVAKALLEAIDAGRRDYDDMRKFQLRFIDCDNTRIHLEARVAKLEAALRDLCGLIDVGAGETTIHNDKLFGIVAALDVGACQDEVPCKDKPVTPCGICGAYSEYGLGPDGRGCQQMPGHGGNHGDVKA